MALRDLNNLFNEISESMKSKVRTNPISHASSLRQIEFVMENYTGSVGNIVIELNKKNVESSF